MVGGYLLTSLTVASASTASAQEPSPAQPPEDLQALRASAFQYLAAGHNEEGIADLEKALLIRPHPAIALNIAIAYERWEGHCAEALSAYARFFDLCHDCELAADAGRRREAVVGRCRAQVEIRSAPPAAQVRIDGTALGPTPLVVSLDPGEHAVALTHRDREPIEGPVTLQAGRSTTLFFHLATRPATISAALPAAASPEVRLDAPPSRLVPMVSAGVSLAALAAGIIFGARLDTVVSDERAARAAPEPDRETILDLRSEARRDAVVANIAFGVAAAAGAVAIVTWWLNGRDSRQSEPASTEMR